VTILSLWEFRMTSDPFQNYAESIMGHITGLLRQRRWGFARIAGPYSFAITAGMVFTIGLLFQMWLVAGKHWKFSETTRQFKPKRKPVLITLGVLAGLAMTQSRGPWISCGMALILASIGLFKDRKRAAIIGLGSFLVFTAVTAVILDQYTDKSAEARNDQDRQNATYRRELYDTYMPIIDANGLWGAGSPVQISKSMYFGYDKNQASIDDEFLRMAVAQGYFGGYLLIAAFLLCIGRLVWNCYRLKQRDDVIFAYCMMGLMVGSTFCLTTVFLGVPVLQLIYLFFGWSESIRPSPERPGVPTAVQQQPAHAFERVFV
jgi:hypothetical protein